MVAIVNGAAFSASQGVVFGGVPGHCLAVGAALWCGFHPGERETKSDVLGMRLERDKPGLIYI